MRASDYAHLLGDDVAPAKPIGAPTKYDPKYCAMIFEHGKTGGTFEEFADAIGVHSDTMLEWCKVHPDFSEARKKAKQRMINYMTRIGRAAMLGIKTDANGKTVIPNFNTAMWIFTMKARFGWRENDPVIDEDADNDVSFDFT